MERVTLLRRAGLVLCILALFAGCTTSNNVGNPQFTTNPVLTMSVGTINDPSGALTPGGTSLNIVAAFRNQTGTSAFSDPGTETLNGPGGATALPAGIFAYGFAPGSPAGQPPAYTPPNGTGFGYSLGFLPLGLPPTPGNYSITAAVHVNGAVATYHSNTATLPAAPTVLPNDAGGAYAANGSGGGTFTFAALPAGVTESVVYIMCNGASSGPDCAAGPGFTVASAEVVAGGTLAAVIPNGTLTSGSSYTAVVVGADYPLVEAGPPANKQAAPTLTGAAGSSDLTVASPIAITG